MISSKSHLLNYQYLQQANNTCTKLNYTVFSLSQHVDINLYPEGSPCSRFIRYTQRISVNLHQNCPSGFSVSTSSSNRTGLVDAHMSLPTPVMILARPCSPPCHMILTISCTTGLIMCKCTCPYSLLASPYSPPCMYRLH